MFPVPDEGAAVNVKVVPETEYALLSWVTPSTDTNIDWSLAITEANVNSVALPVPLNLCTAGSDWKLAGRVFPI
jgi:hypothetical protein